MPEDLQPKEPQEGENGSTATPPADPPKEAAPPWGDDFDAARAWKTIQALREEAKSTKGRLSEFEKAQKEKEDAEKTEAQREREAREGLERELQALKSEALRTRIAAKHGLPDDLAALLTGDSEEDLEAKATALAKYAGKIDPAPGKPKPRPTPGASSDGDSSPEFDPAAIAAKVRRRGI